MKLNFRPLFAIAFLVIFVGFLQAETQIKNTGAGYQIGTAASQKIGLFGATPVVQQAFGSAITNVPTAVALTVSSAAITYAGVDGSTNTLSVVTNVTVNAVAGYANTTQCSNVVLRINTTRTILRALGLSE
jgi:hypothetical protein